MARWRQIFKFVGLISFFLIVLFILAYKAVDDGWLIPHTPLSLNGEPAVLFFNRHKGCACALAVYRAAADQVQDWTVAERQGVQIISIDLDRRPDLVAQYDVIRAPALLLVDQAGEIVYRQDEVVSDTEPFNLPWFESKLAEVLNGK